MFLGGRARRCDRSPAALVEHYLVPGKIAVGGIANLIRFRLERGRGKQSRRFCVDAAFTPPPPFGNAPNLRGLG